MGRGRTKINHDYGILGSSTFMPKREFLRLTKMKESTFYLRVNHGDINTIKNGMHIFVLNPFCDFMKVFENLPSLLTYREVCDFLCVKNLSEKNMKHIGFFHVRGEMGLHTDKESLAFFLEDCWR